MKNSMQNLNIVVQSSVKMVDNAHKSTCYIAIDSTIELSSDEEGG